MNIHTKIRAKTDLARCYAEDGAFHTAARIFRELAADVQAHGEWADRAVAGLLAKSAEKDCAGHVASATDPKICGRCGVKVDDLRSFDDDTFNPHGSGPQPIEPREG